MSNPEERTPPHHVAIIMDGNGRWAKANSLPRIEGHRRGAESVRQAIRASIECGVRVLTLYAFSVDNWQRPKAEVTALMELLRTTLIQQRPELMEKGVRLKAIGRLEDLPARVRSTLDETIEATRENTELTAVLALSYGSRVEIVHAAQVLARKALAGEISPDEINEEQVSGALYTSDIADPDLLIRTSGEQRISNFLLWQLSYTELHFTDVHWPEFGKEHFEKAIQDYHGRNRRFGGL